MAGQMTDHDVADVLIVEFDRVPASEDIVEYYRTQRVSTDRNLSIIGLKVRMSVAEERVEAVELRAEAIDYL